MSYYGFNPTFQTDSNFCRVNGIDLEINNIIICIPQGSCLGPLLFMIYINELPQVILDSKISMNADETSLCYQWLDINKLNEVINNDLEKLQKWLMGNKLSLTAIKTQSMLISTKQKHSILRNQGQNFH